MGLRTNGGHGRGLAAWGASAVLALSAGLTASPAGAQTTNPPPPPPPPGSCTGQLNDPCLYLMLQQMGLQPKPLKKGFLVFQKPGTWTVYVQVVISPNGEKLGFNANLGMVTESAVSADQWKALLMANGDIDPSAFYYDADQHKLYLHLSVDNRGVTAAVVLNNLTKFVSNVVSTEELYKFAK